MHGARLPGCCSWCSHQREPRALARSCSSSPTTVDPLASLAVPMAWGVGEVGWCRHTGRELPDGRPRGSGGHFSAELPRRHVQRRIEPFGKVTVCHGRRDSARRCTSVGSASLLLLRLGHSHGAVVHRRPLGLFGDWRCHLGRLHDRCQRRGVCCKVGVGRQRHFREVGTSGLCGGRPPSGDPLLVPLPRRGQRRVHCCLEGLASVAADRKCRTEPCPLRREVR
mmetsp:Transcript_10710/g.32097  ORF Transcript_10710/g.32097 Transcript_10710/m.32097 type:complete len:224 (-) Transcript_10710:140-811(-)